MKTQIKFFGIFTAIIVSVCAIFISCDKEDVNSVVTYTGKVVYANTTTPFADCLVQVTDGNNIHCQGFTDASGAFSLQVRVNDINGDYYLLAGDATCVPKKVSLGGYGQAQVDLGTIEVEGPSLPVVTTKPISSVNADAAVCGGEVVSDGRLEVTARGVCYSPRPYPTIESLHTTDGSGVGEFTSNLKELQHNTIYYARAYATNKMGTAYGEQVKFTTEEGVPLVITDSVIRITAHSAKCKGHVESDGGYAVVKRGTCWSKHPDPTVDDDCTNDGSGLGEFTSSMSGLLENTTYYVRTYATNSTATVYGEQLIITTLDGLAVVKTDSVSEVTATGFMAYGTVVSDCDITVTVRGFCYAKTQYPTIDDEHTTSGKGLGTYKSVVAKLEYGTTYYVRAYATNETATVYGEQITIRTLDGLPTVKTAAVTNVGSVKATCGGEVTDDGTLTVLARGVCYATEQQPTLNDSHTTDGKGTGTFVSNIKNLKDKTTYYVRAYATTDAGTAYGEQRTFKTENGIPVVELTQVGEPAPNSVICTGNVTGDGGVSVTERGFCYSTSQYPTNTDTHVAIGNGTGEFSGSLTGLSLNTTYYVRAYAINSLGIGYSAQKLFKTKDGLPTISTTTTTATATTIASGGTITSDGGYSITARGVCYSTNNSNPTVAENYTTAGIGTGSFSSVITNVSVSTTYYVRAYATNSIGTAYGNVVTVTTGNGLPTVKTTNIGENVTETTAISGGQVTDDGGFAVTIRGVCWNTLPYPTINNPHTVDGSGTGYFSSTIINIDLAGSNTYYVRAYATNKNGTSYGEQVIVNKENLDYKNLPTVEYGGYIYKIHPDIGKMTWNAAADACSNLVYGGYDDWELPQTDELLAHIMTMVKNGWYTNDGRLWTPEMASGIYTDNYWTSERYGPTQTESQNFYFYVFMNKTKVYTGKYSLETNLCRVLPVRKYKSN